MNIRAEKYVSAVVLVAFCAVQGAYAYDGGLSPQDFNQMYHFASAGRLDVLREAVGRGLRIDSVNPDGDTGLCIAIKRNNHEAYNTFRAAGANPRHPCTLRIYKKYQSFLASGVATPVDKEAEARAATYYWNQGHGWWPWILGAALVGVGVWAWSKKGGGGSKKHKSTPDSGGNDSGEDVAPDDSVTTTGIGLGGYLRSYHKLVNSGKVENKASVSGINSNSESVVNLIKFLPNMLSNHSYLKAYSKVTNGASFYNMTSGTISLGDAAIGLAAHGESSFVSNDGSISIEARNGAIGMVASNGSQAVNGSSVGISDQTSDSGTIRFIFKGSKEGDAAIGMYADTHSSIFNYGKIIGTTSMPEANDSDDDSQYSGLLIDDNLEDVLNISPNSGTMVGMSLFDFYNGTNLSANAVHAQNYGDIILQAGNNNASSVSISLIGMGTYLDDNFLNGRNNPAWAEKMYLQNYGNIELSYQKSYNIISDALKLGNGGLIGMRADASTEAVNQGNIKIDMQATNIKTGNDVATGMLSVHGAGLVNGTSGYNYNGANKATGGTISIINEATSGGVFYGMLAAKGSGAQTGLYKWQVPSLHNYGLIDMQASNSYAMASFAGGEVVNDGVINLGVENGQSYYKNAKGLFADGADVTEEVSLINNGKINVYAEQSAAIYNVFSGSVTQTNTGSVYISNKATGSKVFGGNYSTAINKGNILYKAGNSEIFTFAEGSMTEIGQNVKSEPAASVVTASSGESSTTKQNVVNERAGTITLGAVRDKDIDYGGTFGTAVIQVSKQGSADNKGVITLEEYDKDISQFNVGMWLDSTATAEAYTNNYKDIIVNANNSIGIWNSSGAVSSGGNASATNFGNIYVNGRFDYGMASTVHGANIFNGRYEDKGEDKKIHVKGEGSIGMYTKSGNVFNYGTISLLGDHTTAFQLDGKNAGVIETGNITHADGLRDVTYFWMANEASYTFENLYYNPDAENEDEEYSTIPYVINGYTLGKATQKGKAYFADTSIGFVEGRKSHLFVAEDSGSKVYNRGKVEVSDGAMAMVAFKGAEAYNDGQKALLTVIGDKSIGIYAEDSGSVAGTTAGSNINVVGGTGLYAKAFATADNGGNINVQEGVGIEVSDGSGKTQTSGINSGNIVADGSLAQGVRVVDGAKFANNGKISVKDGARGVYSNSNVTNEASGVINVFADSVGIYNEGEEVSNRGSIYVSGSNALGVEGSVANTGLVDVSGGTGVEGKLDNFGTLHVQGGVGVDGTLNNSNDVIVDNGVGVYGTLDNGSTLAVNGGVGVVGNGKNRGDVMVNGSTGVRVMGNFINSGSIKGSGVGVEVSNGSFTNLGSINMASGKAILVKDGGSATNQGTISVGSGWGFYVENGGYGINDVSGSISLSGSGYGAVVEGGGVFINNGLISYDSDKGGNCANIGVGGICKDAAEEEAETTSLKTLIKLDENAVFANNGEVDLHGVNVNFADDGKYVLGDGGVYKAESFSGEILAAPDIVMKEQKDTYLKENAFVGKNEGLKVSSQSYMFDATLIDNGETSDVVLERKGFDKLVKKEDLAEFFESNYQAQNGKKMYQALKAAQDEKEFDKQVINESGERFYANLERENMAVLRGLQHDEQKRVLADGLSGVNVGADYFRTGKDGVDNLSSYEDDVYSIYGGVGTRLSKNWSIGGTLKAAYVDAEYDDIKSERENKVIMAFLPILYQQNRLKFLTTPTLGVGFGSYERNTLANKYDADTFDIYYGVYNHAEYSVDMKVAELVAEAELNLQGMSMHADNEKGGLKLHDTDSMSLEGGIGVKIRKRIQLAREREIMLALGTKYYHEFLDPYKDLTVGARGVTQTYRLQGYDEDKNRLRTAAEAAYRDGNFTISAEVAHNAERESNVEGNVGVRYNF